MMLFFLDIILSISVAGDGMGLWGGGMGLGRAGKAGFAYTVNWNTYH